MCPILRENKNNNNYKIIPIYASKHMQFIRLLLSLNPRHMLLIDAIIDRNDGNSHAAVTLFSNCNVC